MQQSAALKTSSALPSNFASVLAELADPAQKLHPTRDMDGLADDVATLSQEGVQQQQQARPRPIAMASAVRGPRPVLTDMKSPFAVAPATMPVAKPAVQPVPKVAAKEASKVAAKAKDKKKAAKKNKAKVKAAEKPVTKATAKAVVKAAAKAVARKMVLPDLKLKTACVTLRMSQQENDLLRLRALEAGLTVSAYIRSCTLEVETLRGQVKDTVSQLKATQAAVIEERRKEAARSTWRRLVEVFKPNSYQLTANS